MTCVLCRDYDRLIELLGNKIEAHNEAIVKNPPFLRWLREWRRG